MMSHHPESFHIMVWELCEFCRKTKQEEIGRRFYGFRLCEAQELHKTGFTFSCLFLLLVSKIILILGEIFKIKLRNFQNYEIKDWGNYFLKKMTLIFYISNSRVDRIQRSVFYTFFLIFSKPKAYLEYK